MSLDRAFRFSVFLNLGLACACLGHAEWLFLPEAAVLASVVGVLLIFAYRAEGRSHLSLRRANLIGLGIAVLIGVYYAFQPFRSGGPSDLLPFPANLLPYLGPLLMVLVPAKAIRSHGSDDLWALLAIGLSAVALACALTTEVTTALLLALYLISGAWALALFCHQQTGARSARWLRLLGPATGWTTVALAAAAGLFLLTPRFGEARWELPYSRQYRIQTGFQSAAPEIDLNRTGTQEVSEEVVFEVMATDRHGQPVHLSETQRWRTEALYVYEGGRLLNRSQGLLRIQRQAPGPRPRLGRGPTLMPPGSGALLAIQPPRTDPVIGDQPTRPLLRKFPGPPGPKGQADALPPPIPPARRGPSPGRLPDLGPNQITLTYHLIPRVNTTQVVAEPLVFGPDRAVPVVTLSRGQTYPWEILADGQPMSPIPFQLGPAQFRQVTVPWAEDTPGPTWRLDRDFVEVLREPPTLSRLRSWTEERLDELVSSGALPAEDWQAKERDELGYPVPAVHAAIARALTNYLATNYTYTLELKRLHPEMDPVEEFLYESRAGNCERFAVALMLMLRSLHVPAQVVLGYQGCDDHGDGTHEVHESQAHSWVEVFLTDGEAGADGTVTGRWLVVDATPTGGPLTQAESWATRWAQFSNWFRDFLINSSPEQRDRALAAVSDALSAVWQLATGPHWGRFWGTGALAVLGLIGTRRAWRKWRQARPVVGAVLVEFQARLLALLGRAGFRIGAGQTPLEFAAAVGQSFRADRVLGPVADVPEAVTVEYYRYRFGGQALSGPEEQAIRSRLDDLEHALAARS